MALNTAQIYDALANRHSLPEWAFLPQVRSMRGFGAARTADALALSLWPSRGLHLHGFEIKVTRSDWRRELKNPAKAEEIANFCDFWWVVVGDETIVKDSEIPPTWGLMVPRGRGLVVKVKAPKLESEPMDRHFLASILKRASEDIPFRERQTADFEAGVAEGERRTRYGKERAERQLTDFRRTLETFEERSGVKIDQYNGRQLGDAVRMALDVNRMGPRVVNAKQAAVLLRRAAERADKLVELLEELEAPCDATE